MNKRSVTAAIFSISLLALGISVWINYQNWFVLPKARGFVADKMLDPTATAFRNDSFATNGWHCGEINAKNEMGAYIGFKRFASSSASGIVYLEGHGMLGKESTEEVVLILKSATEKTEAFNRIVESGTKVDRPTKEEFLTRARDDVFEIHWKELCSATGQ